MDKAFMSRLLAEDPVVRTAMNAVYGDDDAATIGYVMTAPGSAVIEKSLLQAVQQAKPVGIAKPKQVKPPRPAGPKLAEPAKPAPPTSPMSKPKKTLVPVGSLQTTAKSDEQDITFTTDIAKMDEDERTVFGWASITEIDGSPVIDRQGDMIEIHELAKSAYDYVINGRTGGHQHRRTPTNEPLKVSDMIESVVFTPEKIEKMGLPPDTPQGWWVGYKVADDEIWKGIKDGEITGFSVHGKGRRVPAGAL